MRRSIARCVERTNLGAAIKATILRIGIASSCDARPLELAGVNGDGALALAGARWKSRGRHSGSDGGGKFKKRYVGPIRVAETERDHTRPVGSAADREIVRGLVVFKDEFASLTLRDVMRSALLAIVETCGEARLKAVSDATHLFSEPVVRARVASAATRATQRIVRNLGGCRGGCNENEASTRSNSALCQTIMRSRELCLPAGRDRRLLRRIALACQSSSP